MAPAGFGVAPILKRVKVYNGPGRSKPTHRAVIFCPHCAEIHTHGWATGTRIPHCSTPINPANFGPDEGREYYLECPDEFPITDARKRGRRRK